MKWNLLRKNKIFILIFVPLFLSFVVFNSKNYFLLPYAEDGDFAVNSLQIINAKNLGEIYGHYSRWGFHHPGPAFSYFYALGEYVLYDWLSIVPSAFNAHLLTGVFIQTGIFAILLLLMSRVVTNKLFIPITLLFAIVHFGTIGSAFTDIWDPYAILFPFLGFIVSCTLMAMGLGQMLPVVIFLGSLLIHAHVAQPLFVIPFFIWGYGFLLHQLNYDQKKFSFTTAFKTFARYHFVALFIGFLFLLPIIVDILDGYNSNFYQIILHLQRTDENKKTIYQSALYAVSFLFYVKEPNLYLDNVEPVSSEFIWEQPWLLVMWSTVILIPTVYWSLKLKNKFPNYIEWIFIKKLTIAFLFASSLSLVWGILMTGSMMMFNSYFYYAITFLPLIIMAITLSDFLEGFAITTYIIIPLVAFIFFAFYSFFSNQSYYPSWNHQVIRQMLDNEDEKRPVYLSFEHSDWPMIAGIALELERNDVHFWVGPKWEFMFGKEHVLNDYDANQEQISVWRFLSIDKLPAEGITVTDSWGILQVDTHLTSLSPNEGTITFNPNGNFYYYEGIGWERENADYLMSAALNSTLLFEPMPSDDDVCVYIHGFPYLGDGFLEMQQVEIEYNDVFLDVVTWEKEDVMVIQISHQLWNSKDRGELRFTFPQSVAPIEIINGYPERRIFGVGFIELRASSDCNS